MNIIFFLDNKKFVFLNILHSIDRIIIMTKKEGICSHIIHNQTKEKMEDNNMKKIRKNIIALCITAIMGVVAFVGFNHYGVSADVDTSRTEMMPLSMAVFTSEDMNRFVDVAGENIATQVIGELGTATQEEYIRAFAKESPELAALLESEYGIYID